MRCGQIEALHSYLADNLSSVLNPEELLRADWVARVSALDLFVHELIAQKAQEVFLGKLTTPPAYKKLRLPMATIHECLNSTSDNSRTSAFDLQLRSQLSFVSYQLPEPIADGIRMVSDIELWKCVAIELGAEERFAANEAKKIKKQLSLIVSRRNKIAHEGDVAPGPTREPWPIDANQLIDVREFIYKITTAINKVVG